VATKPLTALGKCRKFRDVGAICICATLLILFEASVSFVDSSHIELLRVNRIGSFDETTLSQVYEAMNNLQFDPFSIFPEYLEGGGVTEINSNGGVPSVDVTLMVSIVGSYESGSSYSGYESFLQNLYSAIYSVGGSPCADDHEGDLQIAIGRGVKYWSSYHSLQYQYVANWEVVVWQSMYPKGVPIGSSGYAAFPPGKGGTKQKVGYGNLYFFFDRTNITKAFAPYRGLSSAESYYATMSKSTDVSGFYTSTAFSNNNYEPRPGTDQESWEWNPYSWNQMSAKQDMTMGWQLPPNCKQEGEAFFGIPLSRASGSKMQNTASFQEQFDFEYLVDRNGTYIISFGSGHGWMIGEDRGYYAVQEKADGLVLGKDTAHIPIFYVGTTDPTMVRTFVSCRSG
jgi:hypothetical protein